MTEKYNVIDVEKEKMIAHLFYFSFSLSAMSLKNSAN